MGDYQLVQIKRSTPPPPPPPSWASPTLCLSPCFSLSQTGGSRLNGQGCSGPDPLTYILTATGCTVQPFFFFFFLLRQTALARRTRLISRLKRLSRDKCSRAAAISPVFLFDVTVKSRSSR